MSNKSFENMTVEEKMAFCNASVVKMGRRPCVPITRYCKRIERPCKPIVRPCKRITRPDKPVENPFGSFAVKCPVLAAKLAREQLAEREAGKQKESSKAATIDFGYGILWNNSKKVLRLKRSLRKQKLAELIGVELSLFNKMGTNANLPDPLPPGVPIDVIYSPLTENDEFELLCLLAYAEGDYNAVLKDRDKKAVVTVVFNRIKLRNKAGKPVYATSIPDLIVKKEFDAVNGNKWKKGETWDFQSVGELCEWNTSVRAAELVYNGERSVEIKSAVVFHNEPDIATMNEVMPRQINDKVWKCNMVMDIGKHFYFEIYEK
ncbi:MAG: hypothetical protein A2017_00400 [Lentisphaerae bacterium GWF2_44_16]|nr:MAG: hypothetical protein A2017_00400 [Lentisphaerae bacterium GWF2_44_16]